MHSISQVIIFHVLLKKKANVLLTQEETGSVCIKAVNQERLLGCKDLVSA